MDESPQMPRFRRVPRARPRRAGPRRAASQAQSRGPLEPAIHAPQDALPDGDAEGGIHALLHQGMRLAEHDHEEEAVQVLFRALALAETYRLPVLEAQALYNLGTIQTRGHAALPFLKRAHARFGALDDPRMQASVAITLGKVLIETRQPRHAALLLQRALRHATAHASAGRIDPEEWQGLRFALLGGLGLAHQLEGQLERALVAYQQALESDATVVGMHEHASLFVPLLQLYADLGQVETALTTGYTWLERLSPSDPEAAHLFVELSFELGLLCSAWEQHAEAVRTYKASYAAWYRLRALVGEPEREEGSFAFIGKLLANIGTAYLHQQAYREAVAYLRCGGDLLDREGDEEASIPRRNLALLQQFLQARGRFERVWRSSEQLYTQLLAGPATLPS
jgi:tetratricopeptide (TPR) repeat protein